MKTTVIAVLTLGTLGLSGCVGLEVANVVIQTTNMAVSDLVSADHMTIVSNDLESATPARYKPYTAYRSNHECISSAFIIPYERTWPEEIKNRQETRVLPPEPGKIAGYVSVIYRKTCGSAAPEAILRAGKQRTVTGLAPIFVRVFSSDNTTYFMDSWDGALSTQSMVDPDLHEKPKYWSQVVERLIRLAKDKPDVKAALAFNTDLFIQSAPSQAEAIKAAIK